MSSLYLVATIRPLPERTAEARAALRDLQSATRAEEGCELYDLVEDSEQPGTWLMLEKWSSRAHWDAHMATAHNASFGAAARELLAEPISLAFYHPA